ncbi:hypothetical protein Trydic_g14657 [Trypoxylus dichotomus]
MFRVIARQLRIDGIKMRSGTSLLLLSLALVCEKKSMCLGQTVCGRTTPFNASVRISKDIVDTRLIEGCVVNQNIVGLRAYGSVRVFEEDTFVNLPNLEELMLFELDVHEVQPGFIKNAPNTKVIELHKNQIENVRHGVFNGKFLRLAVLNLSNNRIQSINKEAFSDLSTDRLHLYGNLLRSVGDWFEGTSVVRLDLSENLLMFLKKDSFNKIQKLKEIYLRRNRILYIEAGTFENLQLWLIDLAQNFLHDIAVLGKITSRRLDISFNKVSYIQLLEETNIEHLTIYPNPWNCQCLHKFWKLAWKRGITYGFDPAWSKMNETTPICVHRSECDERHIDAQLHEEYYRHFAIYYS